MLLRVLVAVKSEPLQVRLVRLLERADVLVQAIGRRKDLWTEVSRESCDLLVVSRPLLPDPPFDLIGSIRKLPESPEVVVLSTREDAEERARLLAEGCYAVLSSRLSNRVLKEALRAVLQRRREQAEEDLVGGSNRVRPRLGSFVSSSPAMQSFMKIVRRVVWSDTTLLITGETGVGKEWLARAVHSEGPRANEPFVAVNCGAFPESLLESELFGHEEGSFTGASRSRRGWFELAHGGVIFLDEIGEMPLHLQVSLLRVLQSREVQRVGGEAPIPVDVRVMAATNRDLAALVEEGSFRRDLFYRLSVVALAVPPLRDRSEDIPELAQSYLQHFRRHISTGIVRIRPEAMDALARYAWPGNVRELMNVIERAMLLCEGEEIELGDLPEDIQIVDGAVGEAPGEEAGEGGIAASSQATPDAGEALRQEWLGLSLREARDQAIAEFEGAYLTGLLRLTGGRIGVTARRAGIQPRSLYEKMKRLGLQKEDFRSVGPEG